MSNYLNSIAIDLGASSGRVMLSKFDGKILRLEEVNRFSNLPVEVNGTTYWDILGLYREVEQGLKLVKANGHTDIASIGIDTWGNDFGLLDKKGSLLGNPVHYRDNRTLGMMEKVFEIVPKEKIFEQTGIQFMRLNGLYQLFSMVYEKQPVLEIADKLLLIPDLLVYYLTGIKMSEFTNATTTQMYNYQQADWAKTMLGDLAIPTRIFTDIIAPGTVIGKMTDKNSKEFGFNNALVTSVAQHDTGSAVVAIPTAEEDFAYISSGTWSLLGTELKKPVINEKAFKYNFTNEGGAFGTYRLLKNVMGLWILQECKRFWDDKGEVNSFAQLEEMVWKAEPFKHLIDPDHELFLEPGHMPEKISKYCEDMGKEPPVSKGEFVRCIMESLALKYRYVLEKMEDITGKTYETVHIVGGGAKNKMLCAFTARATVKRVLAGPVEATAIGNVLVQAIALKEIGNLREARAIVKKSFPTAEYQPEAVKEWQDAYLKFEKLIH